MLRLRYLLFATTLCLAAGPVLAATDGDLDTTSTGTSDLSLELPDTVLITDIDDITLTPAAADIFNPVALTGEDAVCVYSNVGATNDFTVTATGDGTADAFTVTNGSETIAYIPSFKVTAGPYTALTLNTASADYAGSDSLNCGGGTNASFQVAYNATEAQAASADTYTGTLTLLISPGTP